MNTMTHRQDIRQRILLRRHRILAHVQVLGPIEVIDQLVFLHTTSHKHRRTRGQRGSLPTTTLQHSTTQHVHGIIVDKSTPKLQRAT